MATHKSCDYCGEGMDENDGLMMYLTGRERGQFRYWTEADLHPDCWSKIKEGLDFIMESGGSIERIPTMGESKGDKPKDEGWVSPYKPWMKLDLADREPFIVAAIGERQLTMKEICEAVTTESGFRVHEGTIRPQVTKMLKAGKLDRKPETFHGKVRYRYFNATKVEVD